MNGSLSHKRLQLEQITSELLTSLDRRKKIVHEIQNLKQLEMNTDFPNFDAIREYEIFLKFKDVLKCFSIKELLAFSLIIEAQATTAEFSYPSWSTRAHLESFTADLIEQINPIMIMVYNFEKFKELKLRPEFVKFLGQINGES